MDTKDIQIIGRVTKLTIRSAGITNLPAKIDTGAYSSAIWASDIVENDGVLSYKLLAPESPYYNGKVISTKDYKRVIVHNSFGQNERRYSVVLPVILRGRRVKARFTLADRSAKSYPALIGRRLLNKRFVVDVSRVTGPIIKTNRR